MEQEIYGKTWLGELFSGGVCMKIINFLLRAVFGAIGIQIINAILLSQNISVFVGLNPLTLCTAGTLGISGIGLLYGIAAFGIL